MIDLLVLNKCCSQMFADSANYVSSSTVNILKGIESFLYSNDQDDTFKRL